MRKIIPLFSRWVLVASVLLITGQVVQTHGQNAVPGAVASAGQDPAKLKGKWTKALQDSSRDFQNSNDHESAEFVGKIIASLDQPGGMTPAVITANKERMKNQVRELVRHGALESAATDSAKADPATRMKQLKQLFEQGLINKADYDRKAKEIMDAL